MPIDEARLTQLVLPKMREHRFGKIVNITSIGGKIYTPFGAWYHCGYMAGATLMLRRKLSDRMFDRVMTSMM